MILKTEDPNLRFKIVQSGRVGYRLTLQRRVFRVGPFFALWVNEKSTFTFKADLEHDKQKLLSRYRQKEFIRNRPPRPPIHEELS
jgi:hypothetical protein